LQDNLNRWYDASTGKWISQDPLGTRGGINLYEYVRDNPLTRNDPSGLIDWNHLPPPIPGREFEPDLSECPIYDDDPHVRAGQMLEKALSEMCEGCKNRKKQDCDKGKKQGCDYAQCQKDAKNIALAIQNTLMYNASLACIWRWQGYNGYWCYQWAWGFRNAVINTSSSGCFTATVEEANSDKYPGRIHQWAKITSPCSSGAVYVDDGFFGDDVFVHNCLPCAGSYKYCGGISVAPAGTYPGTKCDICVPVTAYGPDGKPYPSKAL
jgi:hypothetical protein